MKFWEENAEPAEEEWKNHRAGTGPSMVKPGTPEELARQLQKCNEIFWTRSSVHVQFDLVIDIFTFGVHQLSLRFTS
jgi:hypothetical protein